MGYTHKKRTKKFQGRARMKYTTEQVARAYQEFRKLTIPYYTVYDASGCLSHRLIKFFERTMTVINDKSIDIIDYLQYLHNYHIMPMPNSLHSPKLIHKYEEYKDLHQSKTHLNAI